MELLARFYFKGNNVPIGDPLEVICRYGFSSFSTFIPSIRKILFFRKKIKQFNVEFMASIVQVHVRDIINLTEDNSLTKLNTIEIADGIKSNSRQAAAIKQLEMFFSLTIVFTLGETMLLLRIRLIILNNLILTNKKGGRCT